MKPNREKMVWILVLVAMTTQSFSRAQDACPSEEDAAEMITIESDSTKDFSIRPMAMMKQNEMDATGYVKGSMDEMSMENIKKRLNEIPKDISLAGDEEPEKAHLLDIAVPYYYRTCPEKWYIMSRYKWYWRNWSYNNGVITIEFCFTNWWIWATQCTHCYCDLGYYPLKPWWDRRYRCYPEFRILRIPVVCYKITIQKDGTALGFWTKWYWRRVYVPRGCCCRKYWYWLKLNANQCPALF